MKALIQRVSEGRVTVAGRVTGEIGRGFVVLLGVRRGDAAADAVWLADKTIALRVFPDEADKMNRSLLDVGGAVLAVSQFTLYADAAQGHRPSFTRAAPPDEAERLYDAYVARLRERLGAARVATGVFRAAMTVDIRNDGPVTIELCSDSISATRRQAAPSNAGGPSSGG